jgi:hypothetical protein
MKLKYKTKLYLNVSDNWSKSLSSVKKLLPNNSFYSSIKNINYKTNNDHIDEPEKKQRNEWSWKVMKYSFVVFGVSISMACLSLIYEISKPSFDRNGEVIQDEFKDLPYIQQLYYRFKKEVSYYKKVN